MQQDFRFCFQGCRRLVNGHAVSRDQYEASIPKPFLAAPAVEALIPCRNNPGDLQAAVECAVGFYLGSPMKRAYGLFLPAGQTIVFDGRTGARLREATKDDIAKWNEAWKLQVEFMKKN